MEIVRETFTQVAGSTESDRWGVWNRNGIFYAIFPLVNGDSPVEVALHGVRSESEAQQAFAALTLPWGPRTS